MLILATITTLLLFVAYKLFAKKSRIVLPDGIKSVPEVSGGYPLIGHGPKFGKDIIGFVRENYAKYGSIFKAKIWNKVVVVVSDRSLIREFFKHKEENMSLYVALEQLFFSHAFFDNPDRMVLAMDMVRKTVGVKFDQMMPTIFDQASKLVQKMGGTVEVAKEAVRFVSNTSAKCFIDLQIPDELYTELMYFMRIVNIIVKFTYMVPMKVILFFANPFVRRSRRRMTAILHDQIQEYMDDPNKKDSMILRKAADYVDENGNKFTNEEIGDFIVALLYVSSENTALGLSACLIDLASNPEFWDRFAKEAQKCIDNNDLRGIVRSNFIDSCVIESARTNSHVFALMRCPTNRAQLLGDYYVGDADMVVLCEPILMKHEEATIFKDAEEYNPDRYTQGEKKDPLHVLTWGAGHHKCPGKQFALYEIKIALALITTTFKRPNLRKEDIGPLDYFSPSAFAERHAVINLVRKTE